MWSLSRRRGIKIATQLSGGFLGHFMCHIITAVAPTFFANKGPTDDST